MLFCMRRMMLGLILVFLSDAVLLQEYLVSYLSLAMVVWAVNNLPMDSKVNNALFIFNEVFMLYSCDFLFVFSEYTSSINQEQAIENRYQFGWVYIWFILVSCLVNIIQLTVILTQDIRKALRVRKQKQKV